MNGKPSSGFDGQQYARPNQKWTCGHAAEGHVCRLGPDGQGRCTVTFECSPALEKKAGEEKGRWRCTRVGGVCEAGPLPDGACCRPIARCSPMPTLRTRRGQLTRMVVVASFAAVLLLLGYPAMRMRFLNPGPVSAPHSSDAFVRMHGGTNQASAQCSACHASANHGAAGIVQAAFLASPGPLDFAALTNQSRGKRTAIDQACQKCHTRHEQHQPNVVASLSCSHCHAEHRGAGALAATTDAHCAFCHGDGAAMSAAAVRGASIPAAAFFHSVTRGTNHFPSPRPAEGFTKVLHSFATDHPDFRIHTSGASDPSTLKFGHALHLNGATMPTLPDGRKLACADCHQPDAAGTYFRPVRFEQSCRVCHSLQFDPETPGLTLPHGEAASVSAFLHSLPKQYADFAARSGIVGAAEQARFVGDKVRSLQQRITTGEEFEKRIFFSTAKDGPPAQVGTVSGVTRALYPGCAYCHTVKAGAGNAVEIVKPIQYERWLTRGRFDHDRHSIVTCTECHQAGRSSATADILLPTKQSCVTCHSPRGGAADSCSTCHAYHHGKP